MFTVRNMQTREIVKVYSVAFDENDKTIFLIYVKRNKSHQGEWIWETSDLYEPID